MTWPRIYVDNVDPASAQTFNDVQNGAKAYVDAETARAEGVEAQLSSLSTAPYAWTPYPNNPLWAFGAIPGASLLGGTFGDVWFDGATFHMYTMVDGATAGIYHGTSADGLSGWSFDATPVITIGTAGAWDDDTVGVPCVFNVGSNLYMYYRGVKQTGNINIGLATTLTTTPGGPWTKAGQNPMVDGTAATPSVFHNQVEAGPGRIIRVGATYYMWVSTITNPDGHNRSATVYTAAAPDGPWTILAGTYGTTYAIFAGGRFCNSIWTDGAFFYSIVPHYTIWAGGAELELWRATGPTFQPSDREYLGVLRSVQLGIPWESAQYDTAVVLCDDVTRSSYAVTGGKPRIYYAGQASGTNRFLTGALIPAASPGTAPIDRKGMVFLGPWSVDGATGSAVAAQMPVGASGTHHYIPIPCSCSVVSIAVATSDGHVTVGGLTATASVGTNASPFSRQLAVSLGTSTNAANSSVIEEGEWTLPPASVLGVQLSTTNLTLSDATGRVDVTIGVIPR